MIVYPTTTQLLADIRRELAEEIAPELTSETAKVTLEQIDVILSMCAVRTSSEIAWMVEEIAEMDDYAGRVAEATGDQRTADALAAAREAARGSLELDDIAADYNDMGEALSCAIEASMRDPDQAELRTEGLGILQSRRAERELVILQEFRLVGRG